jgi:hypothetical protein
MVTTQTESTLSPTFGEYVNLIYIYNGVAGYGKAFDGPWIAGVLIQEVVDRYARWEPDFIYLVEVMYNIATLEFVNHSWCRRQADGLSTGVLWNLLCFVSGRIALQDNLGVMLRHRPGSLAQHNTGKFEFHKDWTPLNKYAPS